MSVLPRPSVTVLRRAFVDICRGYSVGEHLGKPLYVRHLSHIHHQEYEDLQARYEEYAHSRGAPTEVEQLAKLRSRGLWSDAKERDIERQRDTIVRFEDAARTVTLPSVQESYTRQIAEEREKLTKLLTEKATLLGYTAEVYAQRRLNDYYILTNVFSDAGYTCQLYSLDAFDDMGDAEVEALLASYHAAIVPCEDHNLRHLAVQDFFTSYYSLCDDRPDAFYGKPVSQLTYYQIRLANIARYFKALMEQTDLSKIDPKVRTDPDAFERAYTSQKNMAKMQEEGKVPANMTQSDIAALGVKGQLTEVKEELSAAQLVQRLMKNSR